MYSALPPASVMVTFLETPYTFWPFIKPKVPEASVTIGTGRVRFAASWLRAVDPFAGI